MIKAVIFDFGRTLYDRDDNRFFPETPEALEKLASKYKLAIVSMAISGDPGERKRLLKEGDLEKYFSSTIFVREDKDSAYEKALLELGVKPEEVAIVDDRVKRGIKWGNGKGTMTIWLRNGKFRDELPDETTGVPIHIITNLSELLKILE